MERLTKKALENKASVLERKQNSESKLAYITKRKPKLKSILKTVGENYAFYLGSTTLGAIGGVVYSLCTKDSSFYTSVGLGATVGMGAEPFVIIWGILKGSEDCGI